MGTAHDGRTGQRRVRTGAAALVAVMAAVALVAAACTPTPIGDPPTSGTPGADGPCGTADEHVVNPVDSAMELRIATPTGSGTPWTGGTCDDDSRPVVLLAHGYFGSLSAAYGGMIDHLVSNGFAVVFPAWPIPFDPDHWYDIVDTGFVTAAAHEPRIDTARVGVLGHSMGGGMALRMVQLAAERGWGSDALWTVLYAAAFAYQLPPGPIEVPSHTRVAVVGYEDDPLIDNRIAIELLQATDLPAEQKVHVMVRTDHSGPAVLWADHFGPVGFTLPWLGQLSVDHLHRWADWRVADATGRCALDGEWCDVDLGDLGTWPDGRPVQRAIVSHDPADLGPVAIVECDVPFNPRPCPAPPGTR